MAFMLRDVDSWWKRFRWSLWVNSFHLWKGRAIIRSVCEATSPKDTMIVPADNPEFNVGMPYEPLNKPPVI